jgi:hypothetical protein
MAPVARHTIATDLGEPTFRPVNRVGWPPNGWPITRPLKMLLKRDGVWMRQTL